MANFLAPELVEMEILLGKWHRAIKIYFIKHFDLLLKFWTLILPYKRFCEFSSFDRNEKNCLAQAPNLAANGIFRPNYFELEIDWNVNFIMQVAWDDKDLFQKLFWFIIEILDFIIALAPE